VSVSEEKYTIAQGSISRLEKQWEDNIQSNRDHMSSLQTERQRWTARLEASEGKVNELIRQNTLSQTEIRRLQTEVSSVRKDQEEKTKVLGKKIKDIEHNRGTAPILSSAFS
jgi:peptidoglycan hydrolase CwlO-like protein